MQNWPEAFAKGKQMIISTSSIEGEPHSIIVISLGTRFEGLLFADCQMNKTIENLLLNPKVSIISGYFRIKGRAKISDSGTYMDECLKDDPASKHAILVDIEEVTDLDKRQLIYSKGEF